jgi:glycolate oxidase FAD binding subunit
VSAPAISADALAQEMERIAGGANVEHGPPPIDGVPPQVAVAPASPQETSEVLTLAHERGLVVVPAGGCTQQATGAIPPRVDIILRTARMKAVEHYDAGDLTIGIGAGTTVAEVENIVGEHNQVFPLDACDAERGTIGGALATNALAPLKYAYGGLRDYCTGIRFVTVDGKIAKAGARVVKNVAGYDLMKLLIGSYGTLAVITSASFKVFPRARQTATFAAEFASAAEAIAFRDRLLQSPLTFLAMELASPHAQALTGRNASDNWTILLRAAGSDAVLARYRRELGSAASRETGGREENALWQDVRQWPREITARHPNAMLLRVDAALQDIGPAIRSAERAAADHSFVCAVAGRAGAGALLIGFVPVAQPVATLYAGAVSAFRSQLARDASAIVLRCPPEVKREISVWGASPNDLDAMRALKRAFDEKDILNRGRFLF